MSEQTPFGATAALPGVAAPVAVLPSTANLNTWQMSLFAVSPLTSIGLTVVLTVIAVVLARTGDPTAYSAALVLVSSGTSVGITALIWCSDVLLAYSDRRALVRMGVPAPFAGSWSIATIVYMIGRGVVLRRRVGRGMTLNWIGIGVVVLNLIGSYSGAYDGLLAFIVS